MVTLTNLINGKLYLLHAGRCVKESALSCHNWVKRISISKSEVISFRELISCKFANFAISPVIRVDHFPRVLETERIPSQLPRPRLFNYALPKKKNTTFFPRQTRLLARKSGYIYKKLHLFGIPDLLNPKLSKI